MKANGDREQRNNTSHGKHMEQQSDSNAAVSVITSILTASPILRTLRVTLASCTSSAARTANLKVSVVGGILFSNVLSHLGAGVRS